MILKLERNYVKGGERLAGSGKPFPATNLYKIRDISNTTITLLNTKFHFFNHSLKIFCMSLILCPTPPNTVGIILVGLINCTNVLSSEKLLCSL